MALGLGLGLLGVGGTSHQRSLARRPLFRRALITLLPARLLHPHGGHGQPKGSEDCTVRVRIRLVYHRGYVYMYG